ncbi:MAG: YitT family protein [Anaeroplasmataceae bacterium]
MDGVVEKKKLFTKKDIRSFVEINIGVLLVAASVVFFLNPHNIAAGGITGLCIILQKATGIDYVYFIYILNAILLLVAFILLGRKVFAKICYGTIMYPIFVNLLTLIMNNFEYPDFQGQMFLVVIFAALVMGVGMGLSYRNGGTTGGGDIIQAIFMKLFNVPYSKTMYAVEIPIILVGMWMFGFVPGLMAIVFVVLNGQIVDTVSFGGYNKRAVYIISDKHEEIKEYIMNSLVRGVTYIDASGGYSGESRRIMLVILNTKEYFQLRGYIDNVDQRAFMFANKANEVRGCGFSVDLDTRLKKKREIK